MDNFSLPKLTTIQNANYADAFYDRLVDFEKNLRKDEEVGARLVSFGETIIIHTDDLEYSNPSLIRFFSRDNNDQKVELIQHVSQISFLLIKVQRTNLKRERIGFKLQQRQKEEEKISNHYA